MGVAFDATIVNLRADKPGTCATKDGCTFYDDAIAAGIDAARAAGAQVINLSLGGSTPGHELLAAMQRAVNAGIVLVISAGNDGEPPNPDPFALTPAQNFPGMVIIAGSVGRCNAGGTVNYQHDLDLFEQRRKRRRLVSDGASAITTARRTRPARNICGREPAFRRRRSPARWR